MKNVEMVRIEVDPHKLLDTDYFNEVIDLLNKIKDKYNYDSHPRIVENEVQEVAQSINFLQCSTTPTPTTIPKIHITDDTFYTATGKEIKPSTLVGVKQPKLVNSEPKVRLTINGNDVKEFMMDFLKTNGCYPSPGLIRKRLNLGSAQYSRRIHKLIDLGKIEVAEFGSFGYRFPNYKYEKSETINTDCLKKTTVAVLNIIVSAALEIGYLPNIKYIADMLGVSTRTIQYQFNKLCELGIMVIHDSSSLSYSIKGLSAIRQARNPIVNQLSHRAPSHQKESLVM